jgi:hypothetical protein
MSQNCGLYRPTVHPQVICNVDHSMMILTEANFQIVYQSALAVLSAKTSLAATSTGWQSCQQRHLWQPTVLSGGPAIQNISGSSGRWK